MARLTRLNGVQQEFAHDGFPVWMFWCRTVQFIFALIVLALDAYVISLKALVGIPAYSGLALFSAILTMILIPYFLVAPKYLRNFYHVYVEVALEFLLAVFWLAAFAGLANWVGTLDYYGISDATLYGTQECYLDDNYNYVCKAIDDGKKAASASKAVIAFGAFLFAISLANFIGLAVYVIRTRNARREGGGEVLPAYTGGAPGAPSIAPTATTDPEMGYQQEYKHPVVTPQPMSTPSSAPMSPQVTPAMPPGFAGNEMR